MANAAVQLIRSACIKVNIKGTVFLIDPLLADPGAYEGFPETYRSYLRNPLTPLPFPKEEVVRDVDAVILTHTHLDHWDPAAAEALDKSLPIYVQHESDAKLVGKAGFLDVRILEDGEVFKGVSLYRTACRHGSEKLFTVPAFAEMIGTVMGVVFKAEGAPAVYLAADTVWYEGVEEAIQSFKPDVMIFNTGCAMVTPKIFEDYPYIIMGKDDIKRALRLQPNAKIIAVHMDAINHMTLDRRQLAQYVNDEGLRSQVFVPFDGEIINL